MTLGTAEQTLARSFRAIGTTATVVVAEGGPHVADRAEWMLRLEVDLLDRACSRFRDDSELEYVHRHSGRVTHLSPLLFDALTVAVQVAQKTLGAVDPTVGNAMIALGYDRDFEQVVRSPLRNSYVAQPALGFGCIRLDAAASTVAIPRGVRLDLGSSAKAFGADRAAAKISNQLATGVLVNLGGDIAVAGPPPAGGWPIGIAVDSSTSPDETEIRVAISQGGLASSSTDIRRWMSGDGPVHHIVDPITGFSSPPVWALVSACGPTCVDANALTTASLVWGQAAPDRLLPFGQAVRLVRHDGAVVTLGGWPEDGAS